ncbi:hypothetical protein [Gemmatimonas sp. UBA7669]|uniref:hypothetical protein n=1 Tax=Gemmatimonas sp. UBA7669 TaxID=1946568 RepID=UPI0025C4A6C6|nr:hypothetical protein [Gemmatimonas sp. UBA7669]
MPQSSGELHAPLTTTSKSRTLLWLRDLAIGAGLMLAIPVVVVAFVPADAVAIRTDSPMKRERIARERHFTLPRDPSVTPESAGAALTRVLPVRPKDGRVAAGHSQAIAAIATLTSPDVRLFDVLSRSKGMPDHTELLKTATGGLNEAQLAWLEHVATRPLWQDVDLVARAKSVDVLGARFGAASWSNTSIGALPNNDDHAVYRLAVAGVVRSAWYVSRDDYAAAESALRTIVSLGFVFLDNPSSPKDQFDARLMINIGRNQLSQLLRLRGALPRSSSQVDASRNAIGEKEGAFESPATTVTQFSDALLDSGMPRGVRAMNLRYQPLVSCLSNSRKLFGPTAEDRAILAHVRSQLALSATEQRLLSSSLEAQDAGEPSFSNPARGLVYGMAKVASVITGNPRLAICATRGDWRWSWLKVL